MRMRVSGRWLPEVTMTTPTPRNRLLTMLPPVTFEQIAPHIVHVSLHQTEVLQDDGETLSSVWFLDSGVASWLAPDGEGGQIEVATIGNEGMVGLTVFLDRGTTLGRLECQIAGSGWRMPADAFCDLAEPPGPFRDLLSRYTQAVMSQMAQTAVCNRLHEVNERCARWLLLTHDRVDGDTFNLTHEYLALMLGVRRASVTVAAGILAQAGLITYHRGQVTILDRESLEAAACPCHAIVRDTFERLIGSRTG
jgi:CRP-like cAMP-binding protein